MGIVNYVQDVLTDDDLDAIMAIVDPKTVVDIRTGNTSDKEKLAVKTVDRALADAPALTKAITIYKSFKDASSLLESGGITEKAFLTGSSKKPNGKDATLVIHIPSGTKALVLPDGGYIFKRGISLSFDAPKGNFIDASFTDALSGKKETLSVGVRGLFPMNKIDLDNMNSEEFFNHNHGPGGKFTSGTSNTTTGGTKQKVLTEQDRERRLQEKEKRLKERQKLEKKAERRRNRQQVIQTLINITSVIAAVSLIAGLVLQATGKIGSSHQSNKYKPEGPGRPYSPTHGRTIYGL